MNAGPLDGWDLCPLEDCPDAFDGQECDDGVWLPGVLHVVVVDQFLVREADGADVPR